MDAVVNPKAETFELEFSSDFKALLSVLEIDVIVNLESATFELQLSKYCKGLFLVHEIDLRSI